MKAWVFGGSSGIGEAVCEQLYTEGYEVLSLARKPCKYDFVRHEFFDLDRSGEEIIKHLNNILLAEGLEVEGEYRDKVVIKGLKCKWRKYWQLTKQGVPDLVVISSGIGAYIGNWQWRDDWHIDKTGHRKAGVNTLFRVNAISRMWVCNELIRAMRRKRSGKIILIGSLAAKRGSHGLDVYAASHSALEGYVKSACRHPSKRGITVGLMEVGWTNTPMTQNLVPHIKEAIDKELGSMLTSEQAAKEICLRIKEIGPGNILSIGN